MKKQFIVLAGLLLAGFANAQSRLPEELQTPEIVSVNRLPMRASSFAYENRSLAEQRQKENSSFFLSLNGMWKFNWVKDPTKRPDDFYKTDFNDASWVNFKVPANWEVNGYGLPIYVNHPYEFTGHAKKGKQLNPPFDIPENNNPVGSYRKKVTIPANWDGRQIFIHLGAVKSAFFIWVNGQKVGYSEDSKLEAEFDITEYVKPGENLVALQVYRWSDGSYLECQDMWRISGIERDVYLYSTPLLDIRDFKVLGTLDNSYKNGILNVSMDVNSYKIDKGLHPKPDTFNVQIDLADATGKVIYSESSSGVKQVLGRYKTTLTFQKELPNINTWSAEIPYLYTLYMTLKDKNGNVIEVVPQRVGFRKVEIKDNNFLVNGKRVFLKGINRHEHSATQGHTLTKEETRQDMEMMKKLNVNAVRHSHYPPDPYWMDMCDEYGLYVVDEANIESHGRGYDLPYTLANDPKWKNAHLQRVLRMYERDKNHPSVVTWSLGNEAGNGSNFYEAYDMLKKLTELPVQYERAEYDYNTDMIVPQYPDPDWLVKYAHSNPSRLMIISEYAHIMGNSLGNFREFWESIENNPNLQGGFIWEWIDQSIDTVKNGKRIAAYGGDFPLEGPVDQNLSDNDFCVKGVVTAYRGLTPMAVEIKKVHQYIKSQLAGSNELTVNNSYFFRNLDNVSATWEVVENGVVKETGTIQDLKIEPRQSAKFTVPYKTKMQSGKEYFLNVRYRLKKAEPFLETGYEIAYEQFPLQVLSSTATAPTAKGNLKVNETSNQCEVSGSGFTIRFDLQKGTMTSYVLNGRQVLQNGPQPGFYRAPTDNDIGSGFNRSLRMWRTAYTDQPKANAQVNKKDNGECEVVFSKDLVDGDAQSEQVFTIYPDGSIKVDNKFKAIKGKHKVMMRIGNDIVMNKQLSQIEWYGRGPWENYWDRKTASLIGVYKQTLDKQYFPYARPQESGNKSDVRWVTFTDQKGKGLKFEFADSLLNFGALPYNIDDLDPGPEKKQYHSGELVERNEIYLHIDLQQLGLQGMDSWGAWPLEQYRIPFANSSYSYWIRPIK